jgi:hypothetical protein
VSIFGSIAKTVAHAAGGVAGKVIPVAGVDKWVEQRLTPPTKKPSSGSTAPGAVALPPVVATSTSSGRATIPGSVNTGGPVTAPAGTLPKTTSGSTPAPDMAPPPDETPHLDLNWSTILLLIVGGMLMGMMFRKKF